MGNFNEGVRRSDTTMSTDSFCNKRGIFIEFYHLPSKQTVKFKAFVTQFTDNYEVSFDKKEVYGRQDPIAIFQGTSRNIQLGWTLVAETEEEAYENLRKAQKYVQMMYPSYKNFIYGTKNTKKFSATTLSTPPLLKMKFMNLIAKQDSRSDALTAKRLPGRKFAPEDGSTLNTVQKDLARRIKVNFGASGNALEDGLLVAPGNVTMDPKISDRGAIINGNAAIPFEIEMSSVYTVFHEHDMGFSTNYASGAREVLASYGIIAAQSRKLMQAAGAREMRLTDDIEDAKKNNASGQAQSKLIRRRFQASQDFKKAQRRNKYEKKAVRKAKRLIRRIERGGRNANPNFDQFPYGSTSAK